MFVKTFLGNCICRSGYKGKYCELSCPMGFYGSNCIRKCKCQNGAKCDVSNGIRLFSFK